MAKDLPKTSRPEPKTERSQLMELFLGIAERLGYTSDEDLARLAQVSPENVANWRSGVVREFKPQKLRAALASLGFHIDALRAQAGLQQTGELPSVTVEEGSSPADLQRQFRDRVGYDYLGHRFLYFEPQGALAWENLIRQTSYGQADWLAGVTACAREWLPPLVGRGLDLVSLGSGEGPKEVALLRELLALEERTKRRLSWVGYAPVDVSIPLLLAAARAAHELLGRHPADRVRHYSVSPFCADFEEGTLAFVRRLRTSSEAFASQGTRLVAVLGNVFGNVRDETEFAKGRLASVVRPGDLAWIEVGARPDDLADDPLYEMTRPDHQETASETNRRLLLEGPYRRWAAASGRPAPEIGLRVSLRENDETTRVPGSVNFVHDLLIRDERRACTMLYSRRYRVNTLQTWFERLGWVSEGMRPVKDERGVTRVAHLLLRRV